MSSPEALLDTNVIVAAVVGTHDANPASLGLLLSRPPKTFAVGPHNFAEAFSNLTRRNPASSFHWTAERAWAALDRIAARTVLVGLTPGETFDAIRAYAEAGGIGPRLYDHLIGQVAVRHGIPRIVTWNLAHLRGLFPSLDVTEPPPVG